MNQMPCPHCQSLFFAKKDASQNGYRFCPFCGKDLAQPPLQQTFAEDDASFIEGLEPKHEEVLFSLGPYQILKMIGKGGMGEVYLAYDNICGRRIALKRIRSDLEQQKKLYRRFLREARITSQLTHPGIVPIFAIHKHRDGIFYTMPYVEGITLKQLLRQAKQLEKEGKRSDPIGGSIPSLVRILITICHAVSYAHSHRALHRDLKPENIMIGKFAEVMILDWGLVQFKSAGEKEPCEKQTPSSSGLTQAGKIVGTLSYMAPECALGAPASEQSDIYSLGVILYNMLALSSPFVRPSLQEFRKNLSKELFIDPAELAPYRDVPTMLTQICQRALEPEPAQRYQTVEEMVHDLEHFIEGRSEWFLAAKLDAKEKRDWKFQEHVLIAEHIAITRSTEISDWVLLMISKASFGRSTKIEAAIRIKEGGSGIGFLLSIPEESEREHLNEGYCLWIASEKEKSTKLMRSAVEVVHAPEVFLHYNRWYRLKIEKMDDHIRVWFDNQLQFSYISHLPLAGTHIGIISRDACFEIDELEVSTGGQNLTLPCLAVPDAFLAHKEYTAALSEYRRIGYSFPGRAEGREALFKAGITLLEQAKNTKDHKLSEKYFESALEEFEKLYKTPGAPLEYLGKALVYQTLQDFEEEIKCYALAFRRYPNHPLLHILEEQVLYRMHETSRKHRKPAYHLIFLISRQLPQLTTTVQSKKLLSQLEKHWEPLPFLLPPALPNALDFSMRLGFWIAKPYLLDEILDDLLKQPETSAASLSNCLFCHLELGALSLLSKRLEELEGADTTALSPELEAHLRHLRLCLSPLDEETAALLERELEAPEELVSRSWEHLFWKSLMQKNYPVAKQLIKMDLPFNPQVEALWMRLQLQDWRACEKLLESFSTDHLYEESSLLFFLYGCFLAATQGEEAALNHFRQVVDVSFPRTWALAPHYLTGKINTPRWMENAFLWEKRHLYRQLFLYYRALGRKESERAFYNLEAAQYKTV